MTLLQLVTTIGSIALLVVLVIAALAIKKGVEARTRLIENLQQSHELLTTFVRHAPAGIAMLDREMRYVQASDRWCADYHVDCTNIRGRSHYEVFPDIPERWKEMYQRGLAGEAIRVEEDFFESPGGRKWLHWEIRPWGDKDGKPEGILIFSENISARKEMEEKLRDRQKQLDKILATVPGAIFALRLRPDGSTSVWYCSSGWQKMLPDLPELQQDATSFFEAMPPETAARARADLLESSDSMKPWQDRYSLLTARGPIWIETNAVPERDEGGVYWYGVAMDVSERMQLQEALQERQAIISTLFETASQGIVGVGPNGKIRLTNQMLERMFGYAPGELFGKQLETLIPHGLREKHARHRQTFLANPRNREMGLGLDLRGLKKDGSEIPIEISLSYLNTTKGMFAVAFVTDITVRKQSQEALLRSALEIRKLSVSLVTAQEDALRKIARELHDDVIQRLASLSVEIGNVTSVLPKTESLRWQLQSFQSRIIDISYDIRQISHQMHPSVVDELGLGPALESLCSELQRVEGIRAQFIQRNLPAKIEGTVALSLYRIAQESLRNVSKHADSDQVTVVLFGEGNWLELSVIDAGSGFDISAAREGLGLQSIRERSRVVDGVLTIESHPGAGTRLTVKVPLRAQNESDILAKAVSYQR